MRSTFKSVLDNEYVTTPKRRLTSMNNQDRANLSKKVVEFYGECVECGAKEDLQCDHINPVWNTKQGEDGQWYNPDGTHMDDYGNLQVLCGACHKVKNSEDRSRFLQEDEHGRKVANNARKISVGSRFGETDRHIRSNLDKVAQSDLLSARVQGMIGGGARRKDIARILGGISPSLVHRYENRKLDEEGKSFVRRKIESFINGDIDIDTYHSMKIDWYGNHAPVV